MQLGQLSRQREPEAGTFMPTGQSRVHLSKKLQCDFDLGGSHPGPCILDAEPDPTGDSAFY